MAFVAIDIQLCLSTYQLTKSFESCHLQAERAKAYYEHFQMDIGCLCKGSQCKIKLMQSSDQFISCTYLHLQQVPMARKKIFSER